MRNGFVLFIEENGAKYTYVAWSLMIVVCFSVPRGVKMVHTHAQWVCPCLLQSMTRSVFNY